MLKHLTPQVEQYLRETGMGPEIMWTLHEWEAWGFRVEEGICALGPCVIVYIMADQDISHDLLVGYVHKDEGGVFLGSTRNDDGWLILRGNGYRAKNKETTPYLNFALESWRGIMIASISI